MGRGQAALEFLTTYGWAFMVILIMIGALAYFGVLSPKDVLPSRCTFGPELGCRESQFLKTSGSSNNMLSFRVANQAGETATWTFANATYIGGTNPSTTCTVAGGGVEIPNGRIMEVDCDFDDSLSFALGNKAKFEISATYQKVDGIYTIPVRGEVYLEIKE